MALTTITQQINAGRNLVVNDEAFHHHRLVNIDDDNAIILNVESIMSQYRNELNKHVQKYTFSDSDVKKYNFKPELLSYDVYGTIELAPFILRINNMVSVTEFTNLENGLKLFDGGIFDFLNEILIKEKQTIATNRDDLEKDLTT
jgi:hypothetical protein